MVGADYNDKNYDYTKYWEGRDYENASEVIALKKLLPKNFNKDRSIIDVGGGFGRLLSVFKDSFGDISIFDYSVKLLEAATKNAKNLGLSINTINGDIYNISNLVDKKYDYVSMIRVSHHLEDLNKAFEEINKILKEDGIFILEVANKVHFKSIVVNLLKFNFKYLKKDSISVTSKDVAFLNHHPKYVEDILKDSGFVVEDKLSVSNFRLAVFKKLIPFNLLLRLEDSLQKMLSFIYFGPSIFYRIKKVNEVE
ncbi:class I SAM-dependent methyltransferase [candidate division WWE3 bacterium]|uniref:Class I SAM-dependent methyltransferase n=1 Tax=candidate division WWE3 bacterium TaxID=2053526 RepID=A0A7X9E7D3_UNCKA|nr:class I SAM-dependent methyltransferase [candidate division WWE3 bacterium]